MSSRPFELAAPAPSFIHHSTFAGLYPLTLSFIHWIFIDAIDGIVDTVLSPGKGEVFRHHLFLEMLTDYQV